jgi:mannosyl-3-phosphoglycerate phosphatase
MTKIVVFTDLDGTLLDHSTYSFEPALPAIQILRNQNIPLIICSSKTRKEIEYYRAKFGNDHPFVSENGGGIFIPKNYFSFEIRFDNLAVREEQDYHVITLGARYSDLRRAIESLRREGFQVKGFGDMSIRELAETANISIDEAVMAKERDFDEPFVLEGNSLQTQRLFKAIESRGFHVTRGRFYHILGNSDKGKAVSILIDLFKQQFDEIVTVAIGDSQNDIPMLREVDIPIIVQQPDGNYAIEIESPKLVRAEGIGPMGWNKAVIALVS